MDFEPHSPASSEGSEETPLDPTTFDAVPIDPAVVAEDPVLEAAPWSPFGPADIADAASTDSTQPAAPFAAPTGAPLSDALGSNNPDASSPQPSPGQSLVPVATTPSRAAEPNRLPVRRPGEVVVTEATEMAAQQTYAETRGWAFVDLEPDRALIPDEAIALLRGDVARSLLAIPFSVTGRLVWVAVENPSDAALHDKLRRHLAGYTTRLAYADPRAIRRQIDARYSAAVEAENLARAAERNRQQSRTFDGSANTDMGRIENSAGSDVTNVLRLLIEDALLKGASDIHIEPTKNDLVTRFRIDGKLRISGRYPPTYMKPLLTKLKVDSPGMRSDNFFVPDSGMYQYKPKNGGETVDIRVEVTPTAWGSGATLRLQQNIWRPLTDIGMSDYNMARYEKALRISNGLLLATGPTGSGKTTLLYASVNDRIDETRKIITLEHPIEYKVPEGVTQIMINEDQGMNFAMGLRSMLRQDPNIFLVGEIRDKITADTAIDGAATGHQVFSTLHTNDAVSAVSRLLRLGAESDALGASLRCVIGQRLVARLCINCRVGRRINADDVAQAGFDPERLAVREVFEVNPEGCQVCKGTGVTGRVPVHEILLVSRDMRDAIAEEAPQRILRELAEQGGMTTMRDNGWDLIQAGVTSIEEVNYETLQDL